MLAGPWRYLWRLRLKVYVGRVQGRWLVQGIVHSFGATRCIILHLVTSQSLQHAAGNAEVPLVVYSLVIAVTALFCIQVRCLRVHLAASCYVASLFGSAKAAGRQT